jgi:hypothetical protein
MFPRHSLWAAALALLALLVAAPRSGAVMAVDPVASPAATTTTTTTTTSLPTWRNLYDWPAGHGSFGWNSFTSSDDPADYGFARGTADGPGLWLWPTGQDRSYTPPTVAEWRYEAPGTTRALSVDVELDYAPRLLSNHCVNLILRDGSGGVRAQTGFCNTPADHSDGARPITHLSIADPDPDAPLAKQVAIGFSVKCDKPNPPDCTKTISNANSIQDGVEIRTVDMTLVDDDQPVPAPAGEWFDLRGRFVDGKHQHALAMAADDAGAGVTHVAAEEVGVGQLDAADAPCDPTHHTAALDNRICPASFSAPTTIDATPLSEGKHTYRETAQDLAGNDGASAEWVVFVDRTGPTTPSEIAAARDPDTGVAAIEWEPGDDPLLADGSPPSGVVAAQFRYRQGAGAWSDWETDPDAFEIPAATPGAVYEVQIQSFDGVGNASPTADATITIPVVTPPTQAEIDHYNADTFSNDTRPEDPGGLDAPIGADGSGDAYDWPDGGADDDRPPSAARSASLAAGCTCDPPECIGPYLNQQSTDCPTLGNPYAETERKEEDQRCYGSYALQIRRVYGRDKEVQWCPTDEGEDADWTWVYRLRRKYEPGHPVWYVGITKDMNVRCRAHGYPATDRTYCNPLMRVPSRGVALAVEQSLMEAYGFGPRSKLAGKNIDYDDPTEDRFETIGGWLSGRPPALSNHRRNFSAKRFALLYRTAVKEGYLYLWLWPTDSRAIRNPHYPPGTAFWWPNFPGRDAVDVDTVQHWYDRLETKPIGFRRFVI